MSPAQSWALVVTLLALVAVVYYLGYSSGVTHERERAYRQAARSIKRAARTLDKGTRS